MTFSKLKTMKEDRGFTIVELLIVIIVIAILAAIVIVAYQGVTNRANASKAQTNAVSVQKKVEAFNADTSNGNGQYPANVAAITGATGVAAPVPGITVQTGGTLTAGAAGTTTAPSNLTATNATTTVDYTACTVNSQVVGYFITYYDPSQSKNVYLVGGTTVAAGSSNTQTPATTGCTLSSS